MKLKTYVDLHKGVTGLVVLSLIAFYDQWQNPTAWIYLALHGSYGVLWVLKSRTFPDRQWERPVSVTYGVAAAWGGLSLYWIAPWLLTSRGVQAPGWYMAICVVLFTFGVFFHFAADMQKHTALSLRSGELLTEGLWRRLRNPNYFGELLIYLGFGLLAMSWLPVGVVTLWVVAYWLPNMWRKDRSLARYPDFAAWRRQSKLFIPFLY